MAKHPLARFSLPIGNNRTRGPSRRERAHAAATAVAIFHRPSRGKGHAWPLAVRSGAHTYMCVCVCVDGKGLRCPRVHPTVGRRGRNKAAVCKYWTRPNYAEAAAASAPWDGLKWMLLRRGGRETLRMLITGILVLERKSLVIFPLCVSLQTVYPIFLHK